VKQQTRDALLYSSVLGITRWAFNSTFWLMSECYVVIVVVVGV